MPRASKPSDYFVTVCSECLCASCWHGKFFCREFVTAGTVVRRASELRKLRAEHPSYFSRKTLTEVCGGVVEAP